MSLAAFTWTRRARPIVEIGIGDVYSDVALALWDVARWDTAPDAVWGGVEPAWLDVSCDVQTVRFEYGRQRSTDRFVVGQASIVVDNATGWADPNAVDAPGVLSMRPGRAVRVSIEHVNYGRRVLFRGFIDAMTPTYVPNVGDTVELSCIDALGEVNRAKLVPVDPPVGDGEGAAARIVRILDAAGWASSERDIGGSVEPLLPTDLGGQVADMLGQTADSAGGNIFGTVDGHVAFRGRDWQTFLPGTPVDATIGNVEPGHLIPGTPQVDGYMLGGYIVSTPDAADLTITGDVRVTGKVRDDSTESATSRYVVFKGYTSGSDLGYALLATYSTNMYGFLGWPTGAGTPQLGAVIGTRTLYGLTPPGADRYLGADIVGVSPSSQTAALIAYGLTATDGMLWTRPGSPSVAVRADAVSRDSGNLLRIGSNTAAGPIWQGRIYWVQLEAINRATLTFPGVAGNYLSVPDAANLDITGDIEIVVRMSMADWASTALQGIVTKANDPTTGSGQRSYMFRHSSGRVFQLLHSSDGATFTTQGFTAHPAWAANQMMWIRVRLDVDNGAGSRVYTLDYAADADVEPTSWTNLQTVTQAGVATMFAGTAPLYVGSDHSTRWLAGRIRRVLVRAGIGSTTPVLDVADTSVAGLSASTFRAATGQTVTVTQTAGQQIVVGIPNAVIWRFDANDYPGTGTTYTDPRGRVWTLNTAAAIVPKVPAVPDEWVPADICPVGWERPFARADIATRAIFGRDLPTAVVVDDVDGQAKYGIEPFERTDLLTQRDDSLTMLAERALRVRAASTAPRVRAVTLDARTADDALDLMTTVDVFAPTRYRCRLQYPDRLVFDDAYFATGVAHELTPNYWTLALNLDLAAPYEAQGGHWDGAYWDLSTWQ